MHLNVHVRSGGATEKCRPATGGNPSATYPTRGRRPGHPRRAQRLRRRVRAAKWVAIEGTLRFAMRESGVEGRLGGDPGEHRSGPQHEEGLVGHRERVPTPTGATGVGPIVRASAGREEVRHTGAVREDPRRGRHDNGAGQRTCPCAGHGMAAAPRALLRRRWVYADGRRYVAIPRRLVLLPTLIVLPQRGPVGTAFRVEGRGLPGQATVVLVVYTLVPNPAGGTAGRTPSRPCSTDHGRWVPGANWSSPSTRPGSPPATTPPCSPGAGEAAAHVRDHRAADRAPGHGRRVGARRATVPDPRPPRLSHLPTRSMPTIERLSRCSRTPR